MREDPSGQGVSRRKLLELAVVALIPASIGGCRRTSNRRNSMIVRVSRGSFDPARSREVEEALRRSSGTLIPAIRALDGLINYYAGIDATSATIINVSVWSSLVEAQQMDRLAEMKALAQEFMTLGVTFERPIANYQTLWSL